MNLLRFLMVFGIMALSSTSAHAAKWTTRCETVGYESHSIVVGVASLLRGSAEEWAVWEYEEQSRPDHGQGSSSSHRLSYSLDKTNPIIWGKPAKDGWPQFTPAAPPVRWTPTQIKFLFKNALPAPLKNTGVLQHISGMATANPLSTFGLYALRDIGKARAWVYQWATPEERADIEHVVRMTWNANYSKNRLDHCLWAASLSHIYGSIAIRRDLQTKWEALPEASR